MAESQSMTTPEVVAKTMIDEHADFLREAVAMVAAQLMEAEISTEIGATRGEVSTERATHRNGCRPRHWETRVGEIELAVPRKRDGASCFPSFLEPRRPWEQAIVAVVMEAYVNGVSTRKVDRHLEELGIAAMSKDRVSALCHGLDERVEAFRNRPLEGTFPYLWLDAKQLKVRSGGHVRSKAPLVAYAVHESGRREVIGIDIGEVESEAFWVEFLASSPRISRSPAAFRTSTSRHSSRLPKQPAKAARYRAPSKATSRSGSRPRSTPSAPVVVSKNRNQIAFSMFGATKPEGERNERYRRVPEEQRGLCRGLRQGRPAATAREEARDRRLHGRAPEPVSDPRPLDRGRARDPQRGRGDHR
jgi:hypothetical protein